MDSFIGIDLGTSSVKALLVSVDGRILAEQSQSYPVEYPAAGWTQQAPQAWWSATVQVIKKLTEGQNTDSIRGMSIGGQMHGLVVLDGQGEVIRPCILWNDGRTESQTEYLNNIVGKQKLTALTGNIAFAGFTAPKLLWLRENEPNNFNKIARIMLPKDYLAYKLCGAFTTDYSDAAGTLLLDVQNKCWSQEMLRLCGITVSQLPTLHESYQAVGVLLPQVAARLGLPCDVQIIAGAGDNAAAAVGTGTVRQGDCNVSLGTSGTVFLPTDSFATDKCNALHSFCHAEGKWHLMGCILSAAYCRKWWLEDVLGTADYAADEKAIADADSRGVLFLPYLFGERSPHNDVNARGAFIGLSAQTTRAQLSRAVMEGVAFAVRDCVEAAVRNGCAPTSATICGGGAKSAVWRGIMADVLNIPIKTPATEQGPAYGAAMLAMVGCRAYPSVASCADALIKVTHTDYPNPLRVADYNQKYALFTKLYPALKEAFKQ